MASEPHPNRVLLGLPTRSIFDVPAHCVCGWEGKVDDCVPDVNGHGDLGCPECDQVVVTEDDAA